MNHEERGVNDEVAGPIETAFRRLRDELEIRPEFPLDVLEEAARVARDRVPAPTSTHPDLTGISFVTIDPPGSRDLDQAVHAERRGAGYRLRYAIADVGYWVDRGSQVEREAWRRGLTVYAPDEREPLYPEVLSQGVASLLPRQVRPAVLFEFELDADAALVSWTIQRAIVRSCAQLTYTELLHHVRAGGESPFAAEPWADTLTLLGEIGPKRLRLEAERGGVSLPVRDQHVQRRAAAALGYELVYEAPNEAEAWNAEVSLLTGHAAAVRMLDAGVGLIRTMPPFAEPEVARFRRIAMTLGFAWPEDWTYSRFMHAVDPGDPHIEVLVRQARRVMRGADYVAFDGERPAQPMHGALAFTYAHVTAPLRRLADRYVLDLLTTLAAGGRPTMEEIATLRELPQVMETAARRESLLERRIVDIAEAWSLRGRAGEVFEAVVIDAQRTTAEVQVEEPPIRAEVEVTGDPPPLGARVAVRLAAVDFASGHLRLELVDGAR